GSNPLAPTKSGFSYVRNRVFVASAWLPSSSCKAHHEPIIRRDKCRVCILGRCAMVGQLEALKAGMQAAANVPGVREAAPEVREMVYRGLLQGLHGGLVAWIAAASETQSGGLRAVLALSDPERRLALDAAAPTKVDIYLVRFETLL